MLIRIGGVALHIVIGLGARQKHVRGRRIRGTIPEPVWQSSRMRRCRRTQAGYEKARTSPSAHVLNRLTLNNGMIGMGINKSWAITPGWADQHAAIAQPVHNMLAGNYTHRTVIC